MENWKKYVEATLRLERGNLFDRDERKVIKSIEDRFTAEGNAGAWDRLPRELQLMVMRGYADRKDRVGDSYDTARDIVKWRAENNVDALLDRRFDDQKKYYASWPSYISGTDDNGHLVNFERVEDINTTALQSISEADVLLMRAQHIEAINVLKHRASLAAGHRICKYIYVMDLKGLVIRKHFTSKVREVLKPIFQLSGDFYPDSLWSMFLVNSPLVFRMVWRVIAPMVDPVVKAKIRILNSQKDYIPVMEKAGIARSSIPRVIGGDSEGQFMGDVVDELYAHRQNPDNPKEDYLGPYPFEETMSGRKSNGSEMDENGEDDPVFDEDSVILSGYIKKRGSLNSAYKLRYFILTPSGLYYFSGKPTKGSQNLRGKIDLHLITSARMVTSNGFPTERPSAYFDVGIPGRMYHFWVDPASTVQVVPSSRRGSSTVEQPLGRSSSTASTRRSSKTSKAPTRGSNAKGSASLRRNPTAMVEAQAVADAQAGFVSPSAVQWVSSISTAAENDRCALEEETSHVVPDRSHSDHIKSGFLMKKGDIFHRWRKRYFVLTARRLYYYTDEPGKPNSILKGVIDLHMVSDSKLRHPNATADGKFDLVTPVRVFRLRNLPADYSDTQSWVDAVQEAATNERVAKQAARDNIRAMNDGTDMPLAEEEAEDSTNPIVRGLTFLSELSLSQVRSTLANASLTGAVDQIVNMSAEMLRVAGEYNMLAKPEGGEEQTQDQRMAIIRRRVMYMFTLPMGRRMRDKNEKKNEQRASVSNKASSSKRASSKRMSVNRV